MRQLRAASIVRATMVTAMAIGCGSPSGSSSQDSGSVYEADASTGDSTAYSDPCQGLPEGCPEPPPSPQDMPPQTCSSSGLIAPVGAGCPSGSVPASFEPGCCINCEQNTGVSGAFALGDSGACPLGLVELQAVEEACCAPQGWMGVPLCPITPCDLTTSTCCVGPGGGGICVSGSLCQPALAAIHCLQEGDCTGGQVCCLAYDAVAGFRTSCETASSDGNCPVGDAASARSVQMCQTSEECKNGTACVSQTCMVNYSWTDVSLCGLSPQFYCSSNPVSDAGVVSDSEAAVPTDAGPGGADAGMTD
jgi:hypothetical protein